jgi:anti-sigma-K factor RskA
MNGRQHPYAPEDIAVYALGASPRTDLADCIKTHLETCAECRAEYDALRPAVTALATSIPAAQPSELLKARIMREVRASVAAPAGAATLVETARRPIVWPAYLAAAACLVIALISVLNVFSVNERLKSAQVQLAVAQSGAQQAATQNGAQVTMLADMMSADAKRYPVQHGSIVARGTHLYIAMHDMPMPPKDHVYQAWTLAKGAKTVQPSTTFVPDARGIAMVALPQNARDTALVAVSVEPTGGSQQPTTKPIAAVPLGG